MSTLDNEYFKVVARASETEPEYSNNARAGAIHTPRGIIHTPAFIPVATQASIKTVPIEYVKNIGAQAVLSNAYHLFLQPGYELVHKAGGVGKFMGWQGPTYTDSGGFQVLSLAGGKYKKTISMNESVSKAAHLENNKNGLVKVDDDGVDFISHRSGQKYRFTPELSMEIQHNLGADIIFTFDELTTLAHAKSYQVEALERTRKWAIRCIEKHNQLIEQNPHQPLQGLWAVVQGAHFKDLRKKATKDLLTIDKQFRNKGLHGFLGIGIGGAIEKSMLSEIVGWVTEELPETKPRHLLGISEPDDIFAAIENGVDTFDCVTPTRVARNGAVYSLDGRYNITNARFKSDFSPLSDEIASYASKYSKAYIHHLFKARELLAATICSIHNLAFIIELVATIRQKIITGNYQAFKKQFLERYYAN